MSLEAGQRQPVMSVHGLTKSFDGVLALDGFDLDVYCGDIVALIGPNGAGKTTLFNIITGFLRADSGIVKVGTDNVTDWVPHRMIRCGVARTFQNLRLIGGISALANVQLSFPHQRGEALVKGLTFSPRATARQERSNRDEAREILAEVGLEEKSDDLAANLSYGQQKLLTMACVLATGADIYLLDEPEAAFSPSNQVKFLKLLRRLEAAGHAQFIMATHSPILLAYPGAQIFSFDSSRIEEVNYEDTTHYKLYKQFFTDRSAFLET